MKKEISFTATMEIDCDTYDDGWMPDTFEDAEDCDYDNIGRPLNHLEDCGWKITNTAIRTIEE